MVDPVLLIAVPIGLAFLLPLLEKLGRGLALAVHLFVLLILLGLAAFWAWDAWGGAEAIVSVTGGRAAPLGITLRLGLAEAVLAVVALLAAPFALLQLDRHEQDVRARMLQLVLLAGALGLVMTRDLFNTFVFIEITGIATYALAALGREEGGLEAGLKYALLGAVASAFLLLGIGVLYKTTGTLDIDRMAVLLAEVKGAEALLALSVVFVMLLVGFAAELKLIPLNGPGADLYEGVEPGVAALLVATVVNGMLFTFYKVLALLPGDAWLTAVSGLGAVTFVGANLFALRQTRVRRMLGYSSSAQLGLVVTLLPFVVQGVVPLWAAGLLVLNHALAKGALLWLSSAHGGRELEDWTGAFSRSTPLHLALFGAALALSGLPPFPGFLGKWEALVGLAGVDAWGWIAALLVGSLIEFGWLFGWLRRAQGANDAEAPAPAYEPAAVVGPVVFAALALALGGWALHAVMPAIPVTVLALLGVGALLLAARDLPDGVPGAVAFVTLTGAAGWEIGPGGLDIGTFDGLFAGIVLVGGALAALAALGLPTARRGYHGLFVLLAGSTLLVVQGEGLLAFFVGWELMTWTSWALIGQGRRGARPAWIYMLFGGAAGFLLLAGLLVALGAGVDTFAGLASLKGGAAVAAWTLLALGAATKLGAFGVHVWAPDAYTEAPDGLTPFLSGVLSKVPIFALVLVFASVATPTFTVAKDGLGLHWLLAWLGAITGFGMTLLALVQEDAKKLLAYSSVGQVGYIVLALALMTPLGWNAALFHAVHHLLFKAMLFVAIAGVVLRVGTRNMYQMGGLISRMPFSFIIVMVGIIALSGVPPLAGFTGKWLLYEALVDKGWLVLAAFSMFASLVAFLYLYRLIHSVFLGQLKTRNREVREAPWPLLIAQGALMAGIMVLSIWPQALLKPLQPAIAATVSGTPLELGEWGALATPYGHFSPLWMMVFVGGLFVFSLVALFVLSPPIKQVGQLDIVYAGEVPPPPEQIHFAFDMFRPYKRAFGPLMRDLPTRAWRGFADSVEALADLGRKLNTGNGQTYLLYFVLLAVVLAAAGLVQGA